MTASTALQACCTTNIAKMSKALRLQTNECYFACSESNAGNLDTGTLKLISKH